MLDISVPHKLKAIELTKRISICGSLLKRNETDPFLKQIITGDEKWVVYDNVVRKRSWSKRDEPAQSTSKADIHQKKVMLSVWWDFKGIVYFLIGKNTVQAKQWFEKCYSDSALSRQMVEKWFADFKRDRTNTDYAERFRRQNSAVVPKNIKKKFIKWFPLIVN